MLLTLLVTVPLLTGLICWPLRQRVVLERLNLLAFAILGALAVALGAGVLASATGAVEAFGGFLRADALSALVVGLIAFVALVHLRGWLFARGRARGQNQCPPAAPLLCAHADFRRHNDGRAAGEQSGTALGGD